MKLKMAENSLFAILLRSPWWISILIAVVLSLAASAMLPARFVVYAVSAGFPFLVIGIIAAVKQAGAPSAAQVSQTLETVGAMSSRDFMEAIEQAYRREGYEVARYAGPAADFEITKAGRTALVSCKRWKAASTGIEALRDLHAAAQTRDARERIYITTGQLTDNARRFASEKSIRVLQGVELARLLRRIALSGKR